MGRAISSEGLFCLEFDEDAEADGTGDLRVENAAILSADHGKLTRRILQQDLKHIVAGDWDWHVSQVEDNDFMVVFPSSNLLHMAKTSGKLFLPINDITTGVRDMLHEKIEPMKMPEVWVKIHGIPKKHSRGDANKLRGGSLSQGNGAAAGTQGSRGNADVEMGC
ncbi:heat stress transcription factor c-1b [Hordeum vulgare]|nr:heat stress transcription factor c-1b [Hordeum vulgare]